MPHSSGGGSHGGGHSGGGSHSGGGGSHGGGTSSGTISSKPFSGSEKYVYYTKRGERRYVYLSGSIPEPDLLSTIIGMLVHTLLAAAMIFFSLRAGYFCPEPLDISRYIPTVKIEDHVGLLDEAPIREACDEFKNVYGVTPSIELVCQSEWRKDYTDLETFAFSEYLRLFDDEKHWLFVISYPDDYKTTDFIDWEWQGMIGDDCGPVISNKTEQDFTKIMHTFLLRADAETLSENIALALKECASTQLETEWDTDFIAVAVTIFLFYLCVLAFYYSDYRKSVMAANCILVKPGAREFNCEYCGRLYVEGTISLCIGCGAPIPAHNENENNNSKI